MKKKQVKRSKVTGADFTNLKFALFGLGFEKVTKQIIKRDHVRFGLEPPDAERIQETVDQVSYQKWFEGDVRIVVHTSFNLKLNRFTRGGRGWVLVTKGVTERIYRVFFYRTSSFTESMINHVEFLNNRLHNRAVIDKQLADIFQKPSGEAVWMSVLKNGKTEDFYRNVPQHLVRHIDIFLRRKNYYEDLVRKRKGIVMRARKSRKQWKTNS